MATIRDAILIGTKSAAELHAVLNINKKSHEDKSRIDVFDAANSLDVPVIFRKLKGLLGAYLADPIPGIIITTERTIPIQRFTAAHELGHFWMKHDLTLDREENIGMGINRPSGQDELEMQANSFAAAFLMPRWLVEKHLRKLDKVGLKLPLPLTVYQLALRLGCSYTATINTLFNYQFISKISSQSLSKTTLKTVKQQILSEITPSDWRRDIWLITEEDRDLLIEAAPSDIFILKLTEASSAGYLLETNLLNKEDFEILQKIEYPTQNVNSIGGFTNTKIILNTNYIGTRILEVPHIRPWENQSLPTSLKAEVQITKYLIGLSPRERENHILKMVA